jgi:hypothetical protein
MKALTPLFHGVSYLDIARLKTRIAGLGAEPEPKEPVS